MLPGQMRSRTSNAIPIFWSPFIGAKFYAETNEVLYTPTEMVHIEGTDSKEFRFEFRPTNPEYTDRIDRCEPFLY